jgi:hypothetical protein
MRSTIFAAAMACCACGAGVQKDSGLEALMQISDAQFFRGPFPAPSGGPAMGALRTISDELRVGQTNRALSGSVSSDALSVAIGLDGDEGYWVKPVGGADGVLTDQLSFDANLAFSRFVTAGMHDVKVAASGAGGDVGQPAVQTFHFVDLNAPGDDDLRVSLSWDVDADLDLHVIEPDGIEIWSRKISTYEPPVVGPINQAAADAAGQLDFDSNSSCAIDGRRLENVRYRANAPKGDYTVRVDTFSLCGQAEAHWKVQAIYQGQLKATVTGVSLPSDTRFPHERGAGALALQLTIP